MKKILLCTLLPLALLVPFTLADPAETPADPIRELQVEPATPGDLAPADPSLSTPEDGARVEMAFCNNCSGNYWTAINWGMGGSCSLAFQDLSAQLDQEAMAFCQSIGKDFDCSSSVTVTTPCHYTGGQYQVDGKLSFGCASFC